MAQAKGVLPRGDDRDVLWKNPRTSGYFVWAKLDPDLTRERAEQWCRRVSEAIDVLVAREDEHKVAAVAVGFAPAFFVRGNTPRFDPPIEPPSAFRPEAAPAMPNAVSPLAGAALVDADVLFYVVSAYEARVSQFVESLWQSHPEVRGVFLDRGYQRLGDREPFGYRDGVRNVRPATDRSDVAFVHRDGKQPDEPAWAEGGSYVAYVKCVQRPEIFAAHGDEAARDALVGRDREGRRLDIAPTASRARADEPDAYGDAVPLSAHVRKAGPRGRRDDTQIFRRGLPFIETSADGSVRVGLQFCSFQASLDQFDVVFNDWCMNPRFEGDGAGVDALLDPARGFVTLEKVGFYFVPPHDDEFLAASLFRRPSKPRARTGRLVVRKRVVDPSDASRRFERGGFTFQVLDAAGAPVGEPFVSDSTGRAVCPVELDIGAAYTVQEVGESPVPNVVLGSQPVTMTRPHQDLLFTNSVTQPNTPYGV